MNQEEFDLFGPQGCADEKIAEEIEWMVTVLTRANWMSSESILSQAFKDCTETNKRKLRYLANHSEGRIAGGQRGYKLVVDMTADEFNHWRNAMASQAREMQTRVLQADKVFYRRQSITPAVGVIGGPQQ